MERRQAILAVVGLSAGVTGCSGRQSRDGGIDLTVFNQADTAYTMEVGFFGDGNSRADARAYTASLDIEGGSRETRATVVDSGRWLVRYSVYEDRSRLTDEDHVHYLPSENGTASLTFDIQETGAVTRR